MGDEFAVCALPAPMGLAPGGRMRQEIYDDPYGVDAWDQEHGRRCFVTMANSAQWLAITGERPPTVPPTAAQYARAKLPWFDCYDADQEMIAGAERLAGLKSVKAKGKELGKSLLPENESGGVRVVVLKPGSDAAAPSSPPGRLVRQPPD